MGKLVWYQEFDGKFKEVSYIDFGQVALMAELATWDMHKFVQLGKGEFDAPELYHAHVKVMWTGEQPLHDSKFILAASKRYTGSSDAELDLTEVQDWANDGTFGWNKFPTACQIYNPCTIVVDDNQETGFYVKSDDDCNGGEATCTNLAEMSHNRCLPCIGEAGNVDNFNYHDEWYWYEATEDCTQGPGDRRQMYVTSGGLLILQGSELPIDRPSEWQQFNSSSSVPYTVDVEGGVINPNDPVELYLRMCIPYGCFCGGKRTIGFGLDYIYTK